MTTTIVPTIENHTNGLIVTSETIAQGAGVEHRAVLQLIDKYRAEIDSFNPTAFEMRKGAPLEHGGFAKSTRTALLNEPQSTLLMTFMRNTAQVIAFKVALVKAFYQMRNLLESPVVQDALFTLDYDGFTVGKPVAALPAIPKRSWVDPRTIRNNQIADLARKAGGAWVPFTITGFNAESYKELSHSIRYGKRTSFPRGEFTAEHRDHNIYIRHNNKELTV